MKVLWKIISLICFRVYLEVNVHKNPTCFSRWSISIRNNFKYTVEGDYSYIRGSVKNTGDKSISYFEVVCKYYDAGGNVLDSEYTNSGMLLEPNEEKTV